MNGSESISAAERLAGSWSPVAEFPLPAEVRQKFSTLKLSRTFSPAAGVRSILVRSPNWVGDAVMSLPVLSGLRRRFPGAGITVLAARRVAPLFASMPGVVETVNYPVGRGKWQVLWQLRGRFDLALALPNSLESALGLFLVGVPTRVGYNSDARRLLLNLAVSGRRQLAGLHQVYYYLALLQAFGELESFRHPALYLREWEIADAAQTLAEAKLPGYGPWVGLSPGAAYGLAKRWPPERFAALGAALHEEFGARLVLLGGPEERPVADTVKANLPGPVLDLVGRTNLRQALGVLSRLRLLVTNDSGLMHAAAALRVPLVAIFGSTDPAATCPFTDRATVLHHPQPCSPCLRRTCDLGFNYACLTAIEVPEALGAARRWLKEEP
jgi:heptosyltransferase-2